MAKERDKLSNEELLNVISIWELKGSRGIQECEFCKQAYQQIRKLIEDYDVMREHREDWEHPKVTKEFVEKWAHKLAGGDLDINTIVFANLKEMLQEAGVEVEE